MQLCAAETLGAGKRGLRSSFAHHGVVRVCHYDNAITHFASQGPRVPFFRPSIMLRSLNKDSFRFTIKDSSSAAQG